MRSLTACGYCKRKLVPIWNGAPFSQCSSCRLVFRNPVPDGKELDELYASSWSDPDKHVAETGNLDDLLAVEYVKGLMPSLEVANLAGLHILDFGAGKGALMTALARAGSVVSGVEPYGYDQLASEGKLIYKTLADLPSGALFDGIVSMDVIEHLPEPWLVFSDLHRRLKPGGWLLVSTPNPRGLKARIFGSRWREAGKAGHLVFFEERTLVRMLTDVGFAKANGVKWNVRYRANWSHRLLQRLLVSTGLHGAVRVLAYK